MPGLGAKGEFFVFIKVPGKVLEIVELLREALVTFDVMKTFLSKVSSSKVLECPRSRFFPRERSAPQSQLFP